jgi:uncharacterized membrane protein
MSAAGWVLSVAWTLIILALVIAGIVWLVSVLGGRENRPQTSDATEASPREILDRRLAGGELTVERYKELRETLGDPPPAPRSPGPTQAAGAPG